jgi:hypothetical protein
VCFLNWNPTQHFQSMSQHFISNHQIEFHIVKNSIGGSNFATEYNLSILQHGLKFCSLGFGLLN